MGYPITRKAITIAAVVGVFAGGSGTTNFGNGYLRKTEADLNAIRGGGGAGCFWTQFDYTCPWGVGCTGTSCGYPGTVPLFCPVATAQTGDFLAAMNALPVVYRCSNATFGQLDCGFPTTVDCPEIQTCGTHCTGGSPVGSIDPEPAHCTSVSSAADPHDSQTASGDMCGVG